MASKEFAAFQCCALQTFARDLRKRLVFPANNNNNMSREQYQVPTASSQSIGGFAAPKTYTQDLGPDGGVVMLYLCGDCGTKTPLRRADPIRCKECGCRVLYKERTKRYGCGS